jgi:cytochrome c-type biogenesis protein CcmH
MTVFIIAAAVMSLLSLLFIVPPLLRKQEAAKPRTLSGELNLQVLRDQLHELDADLARGTIDAPAFQDARLELERRVAEEVRPGAARIGSDVVRRWPAALLGLAVPVLALALYGMLGSPAGLDQALVRPLDAKAHELTEAQIVSMVDSLAQRLKGKPDDIEGWSMLARSYNALGRFGEAADAYAQLLKRVTPDDAELLADYADTLAMAHNKSLRGEPEQLIARALAADPANVKALALAGSAAFERKAYREAVQQWRKVMALVAPESEMGRSTMNGIREAEALAGDPVSAAAAPIAPAAAASPATTAPAAGASNVAGTVELDPALRAKVADTDVVFIFARAQEGPRFPLAVLRKQVKDLPIRFVLDDSMSMVPEAKLSNFPMVVVGARISKNGSATPGSGDFEGVTAPVRPGADGLKIVINSQRK